MLESQAQDCHNMLSLISLILIKYSLPRGSLLGSMGPFGVSLEGLEPTLGSQESKVRLHEATSRLRDTISRSHWDLSEVMMAPIWVQRYVFGSIWSPFGVHFEVILMTLREMMDLWKRVFYLGKTLLFEVLEGIMSELFRIFLQWNKFCWLFESKGVYKRTKVIQSRANVTQLCSQSDVQWGLTRRPWWYTVTGLRQGRGRRREGEASLSVFCVLWIL